MIFAFHEFEIIEVKIPKSKYIVAIILLFVLHGNVAFAQSRSAERKIKKVEQKKADKLKLEAKVFKKFQKRQLKIQTKETRKRMKKNRRQKSSPYGANKKATWWYRLWH